MEGDVLDVEPLEQLTREVEPRRRRGRRAGFARVHGLVALGVGERLHDVGRQRRLPGRLSVQAEAPAALAQVLEELDVAVAPARPEPPRRPSEPLPHVAVQLLDEEHLAARALEPDSRGHDARVVHDDERVPDLVREVREPPVADRPGRALVDEQPRLVASLRRVLRDQLRRQVVVEHG